MCRLEIDRKEKQTGKKRPISKVLGAFEALVFVLPDSSRAGADTPRAACLWLGDKESKPCLWLLSLRLHLSEGFYVSAAAGMCLGKKLLKRRYNRECAGQATLAVVQPSRGARTKEIFKARLHSERKPLREHVLKFFIKSLFGIQK